MPNDEVATEVAVPSGPLLAELAKDMPNAEAAKDVVVPVGVAAVPDLKMRPSIRLVDIRLGYLENSTV